MSRLACGIDLFEIQRLQQVLQRRGREEPVDGVYSSNNYTDRFLKRIFTSLELAEVSGNLASLAARFAAKEAVAKALGCGIGVVSWQEIEILRGEQRQPILHLHGAAAQLAAELGLTAWSVSLSHTQTHAIAMVVATGDKAIE